MSNVQELVSVPDTGGATGQVARVPVSVLNLIWIFSHYPTAWVFEKGEWLAELSRLNFRDGLNGQADGSTNVPKAHATGKGATLIEPNNAKLGKWKNYRHKLPAFDPNTGAVGTYYGSMWDHPTLVGGRTVRWTHDDADYMAFRKHLVAIGLIEPISKAVAEAKIDVLTGTLDHLKALPRNTQRDERIANMTKMVADMTDSLDSIEDSFVEEPEMVVAVEKNTVRNRKLGTPVSPVE